MRNIFAIIAGFLTFYALTAGTDAALRASPIFSPWVELHIAYFSAPYRCLYITAGGFVTGVISVRKPMRNTIILGTAITLLALITFIPGWGMGPEWYRWLFVFVSIPCALLGAKLVKRKDSSLL